MKRNFESLKRNEKLKNRYYDFNRAQKATNNQTA